MSPVGSAVTVAHAGLLDTGATCAAPASSAAGLPLASTGLQVTETVWAPVKLGACCIFSPLWIGGRLMIPRPCRKGGCGSPKENLKATANGRWCFIATPKYQGLN